MVGTGNANDTSLFMHLKRLNSNKLDKKLVYPKALDTHAWILAPLPTKTVFSGVACQARRVFVGVLQLSHRLLPRGRGVRGHCAEVGAHHVDHLLLAVGVVPQDAFVATGFRRGPTGGQVRISWYQLVQLSISSPEKGERRALLGDLVGILTEGSRFGPVSFKRGSLVG